MDFDQECINDFIEETDENLDALDQTFLRLEKDPSSKDDIDTVFRAIHTIKGGCRLINFTNLERISHIAESMLDMVREGDLALTPNHITLLLKTNDVFRYFVDYIKKNNKEAPQECKPLVSQLEAACEKADFKPDQLDIDIIIGNKKEADLVDEKSESSEVEGNDVNEVVKDSEDVAEAVENKEFIEDENKESQVETPKQTTVLPTLSTDDLEVDDLQQSLSVSNSKESNETIRIDIKRLDSLMDLVGELVLSRNQLKQVSTTIQDPTLQTTVSSISLITSELQEEIVKSRLQPISLLLTKFQRMIRDVAKSLDKKVALTVSGGNTELDRTLLESIKDPLTHILRNAVDHGIETPEQRRSVGKAEEGLVHVSCSHEGGQVVIDIRDDGAGMDVKKIAKKAVSKGLASEAEISKMDDKTIFNFIFNPGFSTAEAVTNISGRGVGMDVVKTNITAIGGQIDLDSELGKGSTIHLQIPLTLAIIPALIVSSGGQTFSVPQANLQELILIEQRDFGSIENFEGMEVYRLRGQLLPLIRLRPLLGFGDIEDPTHFYIVVLISGEQQYGLIVDKVEDTEEIVVKPLAKFFNNVHIYSGASIMGDGNISLILDVEALGREASISSNKKQTQATMINRAKVSSTALIFNLGNEEIFGIQMSQVSRLEEVKLSEIELSGDQEVIQYRGDILPLVRLSNYMDVDERYDSDVVSLVVFNVKDREVALVVNEIIDAIDLEGELDNEVIEHELILGTMILKKQIVLLLDSVKLFRNAFENWFKELGSSKNGKKRILYVDDSPFYLKVVKRYLEDGGYEVDICQKSTNALGMIQTGNYDLFIFDYEMPEKDGKELTEQVRSFEEFNLIPIIILTALTGGLDKKNIINSGIQNYLVKLNKEQLLQEVDKMLNLELVTA